MQIPRLLVTSSRMLILSSVITAPACQDPDARAEETDTSDSLDTSDSIEPPSSSGVVDIHTALPASILVRIEDKDGRPIAGATITTRLHLVEPDADPVPLLPDTPRSHASGASGVRGAPGRPLHGESERVLAVQTNSEGLALLQELGEGIITFEVRQPGFSSAVGQATLNADTNISRRIRLQRTKTKTFRAEDGLPALEHRGANIEVAPHALVYGEGTRNEPDPNNPGRQISRQLAGQAVVGEVSAELAVVHPYTDDPGTIPGPLFGTNQDATAGGMLISGGMLEFRMSQDGIPVQPATGTGVKVSLAVSGHDLDPLLAKAVADGQTIPKWYLDPTQGRWIEEGTWNTELAPDGGLVLTAQQEHFTWINIDVVGTPYCHRLVILDPYGDPIEGERVDAPWHFGLTGPDGMVCVEGPSNITLKACGQEITLKPDPNLQIVSACTGGVNNAGLNGAFGFKFEGPYDDGNCPIQEVYCEGAICNANDWRYCDLKDNDEEIGTCHNSKQFCIDGTHWSACSQKVEPKAEVCGNADMALDEDCDGAIDEDCGCADQEEQSCYPGNLDQLIHPESACKAGTQVCTEPSWDGDACADFTLPTPEDCSTDADENCDGISACFGDSVWAVDAASEPNNLEGRAIAVSAGGPFLFAGLNAGDGAPKLPILCDKNQQIKDLNTDALLVSYTADQGECTQVRRIGGSGVSEITDIEVDLSGRVLVVGHYTGDLDPDEDEKVMCPTLSGDQTRSHLFIAKYDADLTCLWRRAVTKGQDGDVSDASMTLSPTKDGGVFIATTMQGEVEFVKPDMNPNSVETAPDDKDGLILEVAVSGNPNDIGKLINYAKISSLKPGAQVPRDIALQDNSLAVAGHYTVQLEQGADAIDQDWFVRRYVLTGEGKLPAMMVPMDLTEPVAGMQQATSLAFTASGQLIVGGYSEAKVTGLSKCDITVEDDGGQHGFVAFDLIKGKDNKPQSTSCGRLYGPGYETVQDLAVINPQDVVVVGNTVNGVAQPVYVDVVASNGVPTGKCVDEDKFELAGQQGTDALAFRMNFADPACQWVQRMPQLLTGNHSFVVTDDGTAQTAWKVAVLPGGDSFLTGSYQQGIGFASNAGQPINLPGGPENRAFVARLVP